jgi:hypothetical protein
MLSIDDALLHLGYDVVDEVTARKVTSELEEAKAYLKGAVGADIFDIMPEDPRIDTLLKAYLDDLHDDRGTTSAKAGNATRSMIHSTEWQLKLDLARKREEAASV